MSVKIFSSLIQGLEAKLIEVEVDILKGMPAFSIVGLGDTAVQEAKERIHSAIKNSVANYPQQKKIINLAPAHLKKNGPNFDLPMAVGLLAASGQVEIPPQSIFVGELALDGSVRPINGALSIALFAKENGWKELYLPSGNASEATLVLGAGQNLKIHAIETLRQLINHFQKKKILAPFQKIILKKEDHAIMSEVDFEFIEGHENAKRAIEIAAASSHHILLVGSPGVGKTLLAKALSGILPPLAEKELFEVMQIHSCAGLFRQNKTVHGVRPFRQLHHSSSLVALTGGGNPIHPGEISLAHQGVLFLDEIAEFPRTHIEALRQPLEEKHIYLARSSATVKYPADFTLVAAMNPCPCGYYGDPKKPCLCTAAQIFYYQKKISGPILDRIDLNVTIPRQSLKIFQQKNNTPSTKIREKIIHVREIQKQRFKEEFITLNSQMNPHQLKKYCALEPKLADFMVEACEKLNLSARAYHKLLKVSRTIADLNGHDKIELDDLNEALQYRSRMF